MKRVATNLMTVMLILAFNISGSGQGMSITNNSLQKVVIIRHAEKPDKGDNLSCQGLNRALELPAVLYSKYKLPDHIFVSDIKSGKSTNQSRMYQTIIPFAIRYNLDIDTRFNGEDPEALADAIRKTPGYVLVVWEHNSIPDIVSALGIKDENLKWNDDDYDSIWVVTFKNGNAVLTVDKENLSPASSCK
jgi:hypothetical protein